MRNRPSVRLFFLPGAVACCACFPLDLTAEGTLSDDFSGDTLAAYANPPANSTRSAYAYDAGSEQVNGDLGGGSDTSAMAHQSSIGTFDDLDGSLVLSIDFLTAANDANHSGNVAVIGFASDPDDWMANGMIGWEIDLRNDTGDFGSGTPFGLRLRPNGDGAGEVLSGGIAESAFAANTWYTLEATLRRETGDDYLISARVFPRGGGEDLVSVGPVAQSNAMLETGDNLFAGFATRVSENGTAIEGGVIAADRFLVCDVVENDAVNGSSLWDDFLAARQAGTEPVLPDFSYAGYHYCEEPIPDLEGPVFDVTDHGAVADDDLSDEVAIQSAIDAAEAAGGGVVFFPAGRFDLNVTPEDQSRVIMVSGSNIVLRGVGSGDGGTELFMGQSFYQSANGEDWKIQIRPDAVGEPDPKDSGAKLADITDGATATGVLVRRESFEIPVSDASDFSVGDRILIRMPELFDPNSPIVPPAIVERNLEIKEWYMSPRTPDSYWDNPVWFKEYHEVAAIDGNVLTLREPVRMDIRAQDDWSVWEYPEHLTEVGVEDIRFRGNWHVTPFDHGNHTDAESGYDMVFFRHVVDGWLRRCEFHDTYNTLKFELSARISLLDTDFHGTQGHKAMASETCWSLLMGIGKSHAPHYHIPSYDDSTTGFVLWRYDYSGSSYDPHGEWNISNLNDASRGSFIKGRMGTGAGDLPNHLRQLVFWNLANADGPPGTFDTEAEFDWWKGNGGHQSVVKPIIVGVHGEPVTWKNAGDLQQEESHGTPVEPESLFEAQLEQRLGAVPTWLLDLYRSPGRIIHSATGQQTPHAASNLIDGDAAEGSRWVASGFPQSVVIDLRESVAITRAVLSPYQDRAYQYIIEVSETPNSGFAVVLDRTGNTIGGSTLSDDFDPVTGRFVRLTVTGANGYAGSDIAINELTIHDALSAYLSDHFNPAEIEDPAATGLDTDNDGDGLALVGEYLFGANPKAPDKSGLLRVSIVEVAGQDHVRLVFPERSNDPAASWIVKGSDDMVEWDPVPVSVVGSSATSAPGVKQITVDATDPVTEESPRFFKVEVSHHSSGSL